MYRLPNVINGFTVVIVKDDHVVKEAQKDSRAKKENARPDDSSIELASKLSSYLD